jgi:hypothetical protein
VCAKATVIFLLEKIRRSGRGGVMMCSLNSSCRSILEINIAEDSSRKDCNDIHQRICRNP